MLSSTSSTPPVRSSSVFLGSPTCSHLDSRSATRFSTPGRCFALMPNSWVAARKVISRRQSAWNLSLVAPLFNTAKDALLSHLTTTLFPHSSCAQRRSATRSVRSSRALMCKACCNTDLGNSEWKNETSVHCGCQVQTDPGNWGAWSHDQTMSLANRKPSIRPI